MTPNCKAIRKMDLMTACQLYFGHYFILKIVKVKYYVYRVSLKIFKGLDLAEPDKNTTKFDFCFFFFSVTMKFFKLFYTRSSYFVNKTQKTRNK